MSFALIIDPDVNRSRRLADELRGGRVTAIGISDAMRSIEPVLNMFQVDVLATPLIDLLQASEYWPQLESAAVVVYGLDEPDAVIIHRIRLQLSQRVRSVVTRETSPRSRQTHPAEGERDAQRVWKPSASDVVKSQASPKTPKTTKV